MPELLINRLTTDLEGIMDYVKSLPNLKSGKVTTLPLSALSRFLPHKPSTCVPYPLNWV